jgi:hypothetical protein
MVLVTLIYAWRHGWDKGFVIFLLAFYSFVGLFLYVFVVLPLIPIVGVELVASPVSQKYLNTKPLSEKDYKSRGNSIRPLGIT